MKKLLACLLTLTLLLTAVSCAAASPETKGDEKTETAEETLTAKTEEPKKTEEAKKTEEPKKTEEEEKKETEEKPEPPKEEKVTVYLLKKMVLFDSGETVYSYDKDYNLDRATVYNLEKEKTYEVLYEEKDGNGMACRIRTVWSDPSFGDTLLRTYFADGKVKEETYEGSNFTGSQYDYDAKGDLVTKRSYYDGILESEEHYEYSGETLTALYGLDPQGNKLFECRVEKGLILEKKDYENPNNSFSTLYEYDGEGNLIRSTAVMDGEQIPGEEFHYEKVELDPERAALLQMQQDLLLATVY